MGKKKQLPKGTNETILESISDGVFTVDHNWRIMTFNRAAEEITGTPREEAIGRLCWEVFRSNMCEGDCALKRTMKEGKSFVSSTTYIINSHQKRLPIGVSTSLLKNEQGEILGGVETFRDHSLVEELRRELQSSSKLIDIESRNPVMHEILAILPQIAESGSTVLIEGETGTGKELLVSHLHQLSGRSKEPFISINCGALPDTLLESELFGYKAGAFTGAEKDKDGLFTAAKEGTLLLDEIGETSAAFQVKLLRVLEERKFQPLGSVEKYPVSARILTATNRDLEKLVDGGGFRQDLFYRINVVRIHIPPLRERMEDLALLVERFIRKFNALKQRSVHSISPEAMSALQKHMYPGNIRELENIIEHSFILCSNGNISIDHLPSYLIRKENNHEKEGKQITEFVTKSEQDAIYKALERSNYNRTKAAKELGIHKSTLFRKIKKYNLILPRKS